MNTYIMSTVNDKPKTKQITQCYLKKKKIYYEAKISLFLFENPNQVGCWGLSEDNFQASKLHPEAWNLDSSTFSFALSLN